MTEETDQPEADDVRKLTSSDVLPLPEDAGLLDVRADELASYFLNEHVVRLELAAICRWRKNGSINGEDVLQLAEGSRSLDRRSDDSLTAEPIYQASLTVWEHLERLAAGELVTFEQRPEPENPGYATTEEADAWEDWRQGIRARGKAYYATAMRDIGNLLSNSQYGVYVFEVDDLVPYELADHLVSQERQRIFDGLFGTGWSLYHYGSDVGGFSHNKEAVVIFADAVARALAHSIVDYELPAEGSDEKKDLLEHIALHWGLLKGYVYAGIGDGSLPGLLRKRPEVKERIAWVLEAGLDILKDFVAGSRETVWHPGIGRTWQNDKIQGIKTTDLITNLLESVEKAEARAEQLSNMR